MSYILDALKKAEADRDPDARASLAMAQLGQRRNRWLAYALVIALIANAAILLWLLAPEDQPLTDLVSEIVSAAPVTREQAHRAEPTDIDRSASVRASATPQSQPQPQAQAQAQLQRQSQAETVPAERPSPSREAAVVSPAEPRAAEAPSSTANPSGDTIIGPSSSPRRATAQPVPVGSLPGDQRRRFPNLDFSTHIYADDADLRAIVVNGTRLEEGDRLENLSLHEITEEGAVFSFEGRLVSVSVLDAWN